MCGICGVVDWSGETDASAVVRRMVPTMRHRGPDDEGIAEFEFRISELETLHHRDTENSEAAQRGNSKSQIRNPQFVVGMRRLSIIDIEGGHQPVFNEDGKVGGVLNGEIYNFQELRQQLEDRGHKFRTRSDSEMMVHAYEEWGEACVERFEGMFALAVWDRRGRRQKAESRRQTTDSEKKDAGGDARGPSEGATLFLARDRLGIKPLYYYARSAQLGISDFEYRIADLEKRHHRDTKNAKDAQRDSQLETRNSKLETFLFASEVRTLLASGIVPRQLSKTAVESYLLFGSVAEPMSLIEGVLSLPPGHRMTINLANANGEIRPQSYWSIARATPPSTRTGSAQAAPANTVNGHRHSNPANEVRELLSKSVRKHLIADVPVGVFLSSGIDSTALAALASRESAGVHTFTVAFPEKEFSEAEIARRTAAKFGTTHEELMLSGDEMLARLDEAVAALDQPSMDGINTYFVSWGAANAGLKVTLSGLGGDEIFGGYSTFRRTAHFQRLAAIGNNMPRTLRTATAAAVSAAGGRFVSEDAARKLNALLSNGKSFPDAFFFGRAVFTPAQVNALLPGRSSNGTLPLWRAWLSETVSQAKELDAFAAVTCMEARSYMVNTLLRDADSMSMANSLEVRVPFLDHPLVEFVTHLPQTAKLQKGIPKALLIEALADVLPAEVVSQTKRGFTFPWAQWLRGPLKTRVETSLSELSPVLREVLDANETRQVWQNYLEGKTSWSRPWTLYVLNEWVKAHLG